MATNSTTSAPQTGPSDVDIANLEEELIFQRALLASLLDLTETDEVRQQITDAKLEITTIQKRLGEARRSQSQAPNFYQTAASSSSSSAMSNPNPFDTRKRSFGSSHLDDLALGRPEIKSRKATPVSWGASSSATPDNGYFDDVFGDTPDIPVIDLTGDDDDIWSTAMQKQNEETERFRRNKAIADQDEAFAKQLVAGQPTFGQPSRPGPSNNHAFDRILNRAQPNGIKSEHGLTRSTSWNALQQGAAVKSESLALPSWVSSQMNPQRTRPSWATSQTASQTGSTVRSEPRHGPLPYAIKSERTENPSFGRVKVEPHSSSVGPSTNPSTQYRVPGAFISSDDEDDDEKFINAMNAAQWQQSSTPNHNFRASVLSQSLPQRPAAHVPPQHQALQQHGNRVAIEQARQAALASQNSWHPSMSQQVYGANQQFSGTFAGYGAAGLTPLGANAQGLGAPRPGQLNNGLYYSAPGSSTSSLQDTLSRVNSYNFMDLTDGDGNALDSRLVGFLNDYVEDPRKTEKDIQNLLANIRPDMEIPEEERGETPEDLKYPLYTHQQLALKWMTNMEIGSNKGGILADDMGLGKTISTMSLMVTRKTTEGVKTNLIIGPVALIRQWELEIKRKIKQTHKLKVMLLHGKKKMTYQQLKQFDVLLTTYGSIASEWKQYTTHIEQRNDAAGYDPRRDEELQLKCPILHPNSKFHRVILDEAQCIKNKETQASRGAHQIEATYRWCLTGTPMMNGVTELFPLIRFLRIKPYSNQRQFTEAFKGLSPKSKATDYQKSEAMKKLQAVLKAIMLRRMKDSKIDGKPILSLPPKTQREEHVVFSEDELKFYKDLEAKSQVQFNKYLRAGTVGRNYSNILVLLLRLRQACCHPHITDFECIGANEVSEDQMLTLAKTLAAPVVERIKAIQAFECPICYDAVADPTLLIPCGHDTCSECFASLTDNAAQGNIRSGNENASARCPVCRGTIEPSKVINYTAFKKAHMPEEAPGPSLPLLTEYDTSDTDSDSDSVSDVSDDDADSDGNLRGFVVADGQDDDELNSGDDEIDAEPRAAAAARQAKREKKAKKLAEKPKKRGRKPKATVMKSHEPVKPHQLPALRQEAGKNKEARRRYMHYLRDNWQDSAKVSHIINLLAEIQQTKEKTIIFSQWTSLLDLIECQVKYKLGLKYCRYTGAMSRRQRDDAVEDFVQKPENTVMLVSLRAGNAGLNLTVASRVIICDPFWNPFTEMQAVDRAHRIGQQREVQIHRVLVKETVEDRILELQEKKRELVNTALDEGEMKNLARLSENELRYLFGVRG